MSKKNSKKNYVIGASGGLRACILSIERTDRKNSRFNGPEYRELRLDKRYYDILIEY